MQYQRGSHLKIKLAAVSYLKRKVQKFLNSRGEELFRLLEKNSKTRADARADIAIRGKRTSAKNRANAIEITASSKTTANARGQKVLSDLHPETP